MSRFVFILFIVITSFLSLALHAQTVIAFQGFEGTPADNWAFTGPVQNNVAPVVSVGVANYGAGYAATGNASIRVGGGSTACGTGSGNCINGVASGASCSNNLNGNAVEFAPVDISCYQNVQVSAAHRTHVFCSGQGQGLDASDRLFFEVSLDGGAWLTISTVIGSNNCVWTYATASVSCGGNPAVANPFVYGVPAGTQTLAFRVRVQRDRADEVFYLDNVTISGTSTNLTPISIQHINP